MRNGVEVMAWIEHLSAHPDVPLDRDLVCYFNKLVLQGTVGDHWAGRIRSMVEWQTPEDWTRPRAIAARPAVVHLRAQGKRQGGAGRTRPGGRESPNG
jgi:hypothetical protein